MIEYCSPDTALFFAGLGGMGGVIAAWLVFKVGLLRAPSNERKTFGRDR